MFKSPPSPADGTFALDPHLPGTPWKEHFRQQCCCTLPLCERSVYFNTCVNHLGSRLTNISSSETLLLLYSASIDVLKFDILTWETRGRGWIEVLEKMRTGSSRLSSRCFFIVRYFTVRLLFPLVRTDREPGTGYSPWEVSWHTMLAIQEP